VGEDGEASRYLALSREYLAAGKLMATLGNLAPARFNSTHALELALKAAIVRRAGEAPKLHNVGGEFGRLFRAELGGDAMRRINRLLDDYNAPRYPDWEPPTQEELADDITFIEDVVLRQVPRLMKEARG
jgi:HEPN domain-containing protein